MTLNTEQVVTSIWSEILGITIEDNQLDFFSMGGNSIQAFQIINRIAEKLKINLSINDFFNATTVAQLTAFIEKAGT